MKKIFLTFLIFLSFSMPVFCEILKGGVEYTVDSARTIAFQNTDLKISKSEFVQDLKDPLHPVNTLICIRKGLTHDDFYKPRKIVPFYDKDNKTLLFYGVQYDDLPAKKYYYSPAGILGKYEITTFNGSYPYKTLAYDTKGKLYNINLVVSQTESYLFDSKKNLVGHWLNNQFYDANGNLDMTRRL